MAKRRMFSMDIVDTDLFLEMPSTSQLLYFHLSMRADDDGFVSSPKKIMKFVGAADDDLKLLLAKDFIIPFDNGVCVIKHWKIHNYIKADRYHETIYKDEKARLSEDSNKIYSMDTKCIQDVSRVVPEVRLGKVRLGKVSKEKFKKPQRQEFEEYCKEIEFDCKYESFYDYYQAKDWMIGKNRMKNWQAAVRTWKRREPKSEQKTSDVHVDNCLKFGGLSD